MRYATLIFAVLLGHVVSAEATEVLLKARDQATTNWAKVISKRFKATVEKLIPGLNAVILQVPAANVASFVKSAHNNPAISAVEAVSDYRQLFRLTPSTNFDDVKISQAQKEAVSRLRERKTSASVYVAQVRPADISLDLLRGALTIADGFTKEKGIKLNLAPGVKVDALQKEITQRGPSSFVWNGEVENRGAARARRNGIATFVVQDGKISGSVVIGSDVYIINPLGNGLHAIVKTNPSVYPPEHPPGTAPKIHDAPEPRLQKEGMLQDQSTIVVRALVVYTPAVRKALDQFGSSPDTLATLAIESTNLASKNSNVRMLLKLVKAEEIAYVERDFPSDLAMLQGSAWVKAEREAAKANVVFLLTTVFDYCGLSDVVLADKNSAFAVINYICAVGNFSLAHEFGHLLGLRHERAADEADKPFRNGHGYVYKNEWRTIMATRKACNSCPRIPFWSNPSIKYNGVPLGTKDYEDEADVINDTAPIIAGFQ
ncbi:MAG: M12 family metallo-peptidase [Pseudolabrys sp.]